MIALKYAWLFAWVQTAVWQTKLTRDLFTSVTFISRNCLLLRFNLHRI